MVLRTYEITFTGQAGPALHEEFDDCEIISGRGTTTLRAELPDQAGLWGIVQRIIGLGLQVIDLHLVSGQSAGTSAGSDHLGHVPPVPADVE